MNKPLSSEKIAILVANGFCEQDMTSAQRSLLAQGANVRVISMDNTLVNSWNGMDWGLHFAADAALNSVLAVDFSMLVIPGGRRSIEKLKLTRHTKRFIGGFLDMDKPVVAFGDALDLLVMSDKVAGRKVTGPAEIAGRAKEAGATWSSEMMVMDGNMMTGMHGDDDRGVFVDAMMDYLMQGIDAPMDIVKAA